MESPTPPETVSSPDTITSNPRAQKRCRPSTSGTVHTLASDDDGDLFVSLFEKNGRETVSYYCLQTSSQAMSLASEAFRSLITAAKEKKSCKRAENPVWIDLETSSYAAAYIVLKIIHHRNAQNPNTVELLTMFHIANFCDRYALQGAVYPSLANWINTAWSSTPQKKCVTLTKNTPPQSRQEDPSLPHPHSKYDCGLWIRIARVFSIDEILRECGQSAVFHARKCSPGESELCNPALKVIWKHREGLLKRLVDVVDSKLKSFETAIRNKTPACTKNKDTAKQCDMCQMGEILQLKIRLGCTSLCWSDTQLASLSLYEIVQAFKKVDGCGSAIKYSREDCSLGTHRSCNISIDFRKIAAEVEKTDIREALLAAFYEERHEGPRHQ
ncbi:hypothetical protein TWF281_001428 [Arthrobotrys megalospora]